MKIEKRRWLFEDQVPVETNVTLFKILSCVVVIVCLATALGLIILVRSIWAVCVIIPVFLFIGFLFMVMVWEICTNYSEDYFDELHGRTN